MYDTVSAIVGELPPSVLDSPFWRHERTNVDRTTGEITRTRTLNAVGGPMLTLHGDGRALKVERSLPKCYRGENVTDLTGPAVAVALAMLDGEIADALGTDELPSVGEWSAVRLDYPRTIHLGDEAEVRLTLGKWGRVAMPYKGLPVIGQSGSVTWSKGNIKLKAYSKYAESHDPRALGDLRVEPGVFRLATFRKLLGREDASPVRLLDVLTPAMHAAVNGRFESHLRGDLMSEVEIGTLDLLRRMVGFFGPGRTATLIGYAVLYTANGVTRQEDIPSVDVGSIDTRYRVLREFRAFRAHLVAQGYRLSEEGTESADVEELLQRVGPRAA